MKNITLRRFAVVVLLVLTAACRGLGPTTPTGTSQLPVLDSPAPPSATDFPPMSGPSRTFIFDHELSDSVSDVTRSSRFVLYDSGAFALQYDGGREYPGKYAESDGVITFEWEGGSATGTLEGDKMTVK